MPYTAVEEDRDRILLPAIRRHLRPGIRSLVDVGGGDGRVLAALCRAITPRPHLALTDASPGMRSRARERLSGLGVDFAEAPRVLPQASWDAALLVAVWMELPTEDACVGLLREIHDLLTPDGLLLAAVTHPCFRDRRFRTFEARFSMRDYFESGRPFDVEVSDGTRSVVLRDTHWTLTDHCRQLRLSGFTLEAIEELADTSSESEGAPWLLLVARRTAREVLG
jgi:SAM-dependent methyltransferase